MNNDFFLTASGLTGLEQNKFAKWLQQRNNVFQIEQYFEDNPELVQAENATESLEDLRHLAKRKVAPPAPGQIRMLDRTMTSDTSIVTPLLILSQWSDRHWLIAPFAPYTEPATPGELATGIDFPAYKVVEAWNAMVVPEVFLYTHTAFLRDAGEAVRHDACELFFQQLEGTQLPDRLQPRVGAPIQAKWDPRIQYLLSEKEQFSPLREALEQAKTFLDNLPPISLFNATQMRLAAEDKQCEEYFLAIAGRDEVLKFFTGKDEIRVRVYTDSACKDYATTLDSWLFLSEYGNVLGTIEQSKCRFPQANAGEYFAISAPDGSLYTLKMLGK